MEQVIGSGAAAWGVVMALSPVLQIRRMIRTRSSRDVSVGYFALLLPGFLLWVAYGAAISNAVLVIPNAVAATVDLAVIALALALHSTRSQADLRRTVGRWRSGT